MDEAQDVRRLESVFLRVIKLFIFDINKVVLAVVSGLPSVFFAVAMPWRIWNEGVNLVDIAASHDPLVEETAQFTISLLEIADEILLAGVYVLVVQGTVLIYVLPSHLVNRLGELSPALKGLTSGTLKEKVISTIKIASALYLFKIMLELIAHKGEVDWRQFAILGVFHLLFICGYAVMSWFNLRHDNVHAAHDSHTSTTSVRLDKKED